MSAPHSSQRLALGSGDGSTMAAGESIIMPSPFSLASCSSSRSSIMSPSSSSASSSESEASGSGGGVVSEGGGVVSEGGI